MQRRVSALSLVAFITLSFVGCKAHSPAESPTPQRASASPIQPAPTPVPSTIAPAPSAVITPKPPVYSWKQLTSETIELQAFDEHTYQMPRGGKFRISVKADTAVFGGVFYRKTLPKRQLLKPEFAHSICSLMEVVQGQATCRFSSGSDFVYVLRDKRSDLTLAVGIFGLKHFQTKPMERATAPNRVAITIEDWDCVENCINQQR